MITRIHIRNFKSLRDVEVKLDPLTLLIGRSGSGKTNFVEAVRFLRGVLNGGEQFLQKLHDQAAGRESWKQIFSATAAAGDPIEFDCSFRVDGVEGDFGYFISIGQPKNSRHRILRESLQLGKEILYDVLWGKPEGKQPGQDRYYWISPPRLLNPPEPSDGTIPIIASLPALENVVVAHVVLTRGIGCYDFPGNVLRNTPNGNARAPQGPGLDDDGVNYLGVMQELVSNIADLSIRKRMLVAMQQINPTVATVELNDLRQPTSAIVSHDIGQTGRLSFRLSQESEGFRRFYAQLLALYQTPPKQTLFFEEPEKGIYPGALGVLAGEFVRCAQSGRSQVVLTTHSPELLNHLPPEAIRVVQIENNSTRISRLAPEQMEAVRQDLLTTGELLTVDPARGDVGLTK